jgi:uncharacterized Zn finger protein
VPVSARRRTAAAEIAALRRQGRTLSPVEVSGRLIARTFWGKAWCENLERYSDFENRLPRGRSYVRNGSVIDLQISKGKVTALVRGSSLYTVSIDVQPVDEARWAALVNECWGKIESVVELLQGKIPGSVMELITRRGAGLFPAPADIRMACSCPDRATMCKHVAAVLYGIGARLDQQPELMFELRSVNPADLASRGLLRGGKEPAKEKALKGADLSQLFGIDLEDPEAGEK